ncbi:hypothetical protein HOF65_03960 [bacterium]|nr:hypothetical protein [bacterium]MBT3853124.1 hypothetical protein [bacterium]MBT4633659.1 hypothetical protein [bacterium]MBT6778531.1 hypothetical protein [bacterium]
MTKLENNHTRAQTIISSGQCTHSMTLDNNIIITKGVNIYHIFLYQEKYILDKKATATVA